MNKVNRSLALGSLQCVEDPDFNQIFLKKDGNFYVCCRAEVPRARREGPRYQGQLLEEIQERHSMNV